MTRSFDDGVRGKVGVCLSLRRTERGIELTMDDVVLHESAGGPHRLWHHDRFITFADVSNEQLGGGMSEEDYARFGRFIFGDIAALAKFRLDI